MSGRTVLILLALLASTACASGKGTVQAETNDEFAEQNAIEATIKDLVVRKDFAALNAMEDDFRSQRWRTPSGTWKLSVFYTVLVKVSPGAATFGGCETKDQKFFDAWIAAAPKKPAAYISKADNLIHYAYCLRGKKMAPQTSPEAMRAFAEQIDKARELLDRHRDAASVDPQYYTEMMEIYRATGVDRDAFEALLDEATASEPYYYNHYFAAADYYLPQWMGVPGDQDRIARYAAGRTSSDGMGGYARVIRYFDACNCLNRAEVDWPTLKLGMYDVAEQYPSDWNLGNYAMLACKFNDGETTAALFDKMERKGGSPWEAMDGWPYCNGLAQVHKRGR